MIAIRTIIGLENASKLEGGSRYRNNLRRVLPHIEDAYRGEEESFRTHLGASLIGRNCAREIWYGFHWASKTEHEGRMLRLFNRGHLEEGRFIALLLTAGYEVYQQDAQGKQYRISEYGGHFGGSGDGVVIGCPDLPSGSAALSEFKTHNDKSFIKLAGANWKKYVEHILDQSKPKAVFEGEGVRTAKYEHWMQMQMYMRKMGLAVGLYFATNKNDDSIYVEVVNLESETADTAITRAGMLISTQQAPPMINKSVSWYGCNFCDHKPVCKLGKPPEINCRTCHYSEPNMETGEWACTNSLRKENPWLSKAVQLKGCAMYVKNPTM